MLNCLFGKEALGGAVLAWTRIQVLQWRFAENDKPFGKKSRVDFNLYGCRDYARLVL